MLLAKKIFIFMIMSVSVVVGSALAYTYFIPNARNTFADPEQMVFEDVELDSEQYELVYANGQFNYYYRAATDVFLIKDLRNGYTWKSGIDQQQEAIVRQYCDELRLRKYRDGDESITEEMIEEAGKKVISNLGGALLDRANSSICVYYVNNGESLGTGELSLASAGSDVKKEYGVNGNVMQITYDFSKKIDLKIAVQYHFTETGIEVKIPDENITGSSQNTKNADGVESKTVFTKLEVFPFMGATGGTFRSFDITISSEATDDEGNPYTIWGEYAKESVYDDSVDGYAVVPDGTGSLMRFRENSQVMDAISLPVYGVNEAQSLRYRSVQLIYELKNASLPLFGMAHGRNQAAYAAYAKSGDYYMTINASPSGSNNINWNFAYASFEYNKYYEQIYNQVGDFAGSLFVERNHFDIDLCFEFLSGDGKIDGLAANYVGIANVYKNYLEREFNLESKKDSTNVVSDIPMRLDFLMADSQKSIIGYEDVIVTSSWDVRDIVKDIYNNGMKNLSVGIMGYQAGGLTLGQLDEIVYSNSIGSRGDYWGLFYDLAELGIDTSFMQNYYTTNSAVVDESRDVVRHYSGWYREHLNVLYDWPFPITEFLRPERAYQYGTQHVNWFVKDTGVKGMTFTGISNNIITDYRDSIEEGITYYERLFKETAEKMEVNASAPNAYLWPYITRYLSADAYSTQFLAETDTIPLISFILHDYVEVFSEYSNFGLNTPEEVLRLIDYNVYPSFVLTKQPSNLLSKTSSNLYYATEYASWSEDVKSIYGTMNGALKFVENAKWIDRVVVDSGIVVNKYSNGVEIVLNYTDADYNYSGKIVGSLKSEVIQHG